jgi:hypothetical protein
MPVPLRKARFIGNVASERRSKKSAFAPGLFQTVAG